VQFVHGSRCVAKAETDPEHFSTEVQYYQQVAASQDALQEIMPRLIQVKENPRVMLLEDLTRLVRTNDLACAVMDVKLGVRSFRADVSNVPKPEYFEKYRACVKDMAPELIDGCWRESGAHSASAASSTNTTSAANHAGIRRLSNLGEDVVKRLESKLDADKAPLARLNSLLGLDDDDGDAHDAPGLQPPSRKSSKSSVDGAGGGVPPASLEQGLLGKRDYLLFRDATTTSAKHGFRLTALTSAAGFDVSQDEARQIHSMDEFKRCVLGFANQGDAKLLRAFCADLQHVLSAMDRSALFPNKDFVGTSLLFLHCAQTGKTAVRWIDFANVGDVSSADHNRIRGGVVNLCGVFEELVLAR
jgi:hypothetical protein